MVFLIMVGCCSFFHILLGTLFGSAFLLELPARAARGIVFPRFPRLVMLSGVTLVN